MNIGVFGGSFDPIHNGHLEVVKEALKSQNFDKLFVIPAYLSPFKVSSMVPATTRLKWVHQTFDNFSNVEVLDYETKQDRSVPTIETVEYILKHFKPSGKIKLIIGADNVATLNKWHNYEKLIEICEIIVATRSGYSLQHEYNVLRVKYDISSTEIRNSSSFDHLPKCVADEIIQYYKKRG